MNSSPSIALLAAALSAAQSRLQGALKGNTNPHLKSKYADLASVWDACRPVLAENGLSVIQLPSAVGPVVTVETVLAHKSGEWISGSLSMTAQQNTPQGIGSAITYGRRYGLGAIVGVSPEDDDGHAASTPRHTTSPAPSSAPVAPAAATEEMEVKAGRALMAAKDKKELDACVQEISKCVKEGLIGAEGRKSLLAIYTKRLTEVGQ